MTSGQPASDKSYLNRALEISIHIGLIVLLAAACLIILSPFIADGRLGSDHRHCQLSQVLPTSEITWRTRRLCVRPVHRPPSHHLNRAGYAACSNPHRELPCPCRPRSEWHADHSAAAVEHRNLAHLSQAFERPLEPGLHQFRCRLQPSRNSNRLRPGCSRLLRESAWGCCSSSWQY